MEKNILVVPAFETGRGGGHLVRCIALTQRLRAEGREAWLYFTAEADSLFKNANFDCSWIIDKNGLQNKKWDFIILDFFKTSREELFRWKQIAPVIGIDEGGYFRDGFDFLIDILIPENFISPPANISSPSLLPLPKRKEKTAKKAESKKIKILISFGQEDRKGLGVVVARSLVKKSSKNTEITLLRGSLNKSSFSPSLPNVRIIDAIPNLAEHLDEYDLVITHYGITAYEALYTGTPVLLASPTPYHAKLAKAAGFRTFSSNFNINIIKTLEKHCKALAVKFELDKESADIAALIGGYSPQVNRHCPVCGKKAQDRSVARFKDRTYRRCKHCGIIYMDRTCPPSIEYEREYFFESYKKQYGKTYLEDFPN
ncbi:MAG: hypothetical protein LBQ93_06740 [Treponema sp.]|nr:hypothetical protein [Treponema sp.]